MQGFENSNVGKAKSNPPLMRPKKSLQRKMLTGAVFIAIAPTVICIAVFSFFIHDRIVDQHSQDGRTIAEMLALSLGGKVSSGWSRTQGELVDSISKDPRVSFVIIFDNKGAMRHAGVFHDPIWQHFQKNHRATQQPLQSGEKGSTIADQGTIAYKIPIFAEKDPRSSSRAGHGEVDSSKSSTTVAKGPPSGKGVRPARDEKEKPGSATTADSPSRPIEGTLVFAMQQPSIQKSMAEFHASQLIIVLGAVLLFLPMVSVLFRKWRKPLLELVKATRELAEGNPPTPVAVRAHDELGFLASAFNDMAGKIKAQHTALADANETLEAKVRSRTKQLSEAMEELDRAASTDALTGVANRRAFNEALEDQYAVSKRMGHDLICVMVDLDGFKPVNDTLGHKTGDELLNLAAKIMRENCRGSDMVARVGGDEFVLLMPSADAESAKETAELILERFKQAAAELLHCDEIATRVSFSMGMSSLAEHEAESPEVLLDQADRALYNAKENGKAQLCIYDGKMAA